VPLGCFGLIPAAQDFGGVAIFNCDTKTCTDTELNYAVALHIAFDRTPRGDYASWFQSLRAPPCSRSRIVPSHRYRSSASDDRINQRQIRVWVRCHQY